VCLPVTRPAESNLYDPAFRAPSGCIEEPGFFENIKEIFLNNVFRFGAVIQDTKSDSEYQPGIASKQQIQSFGISGL
jgi:hypothetical protein